MIITDEMIEKGAVALAKSTLTQKGRDTFEWEMFAASERIQFMAQSVSVLYAAFDIVDHSKIVPIK